MICRTVSENGTYILLRNCTDTGMIKQNSVACRTYYYKVIALHPQLTWGKISGTKQYRIYRSLNGKSWSLVKSTTATSFIDKTAKAGKIYYYRVMAIHNNAKANSVYSTIDKIVSK